MKRSAMLVTIAIIVIVALALVYIFTRDTPAESENPTTQQKSTLEDTEFSPPTESQTGAGIYTDYSSDALAKSSDTTLLFFHAPWCPQCRAVDADIKADGVPENVTVLKVDYDSRQDLRQKYGVTLQTTFVSVDANGEKIDSYVAYEEPTFDSVLRELVE